MTMKSNLLDSMLDGPLTESGPKLAMVMGAPGLVLLLFLVWLVS